MGASSGMGKELAQLFYDAGWTVGVVARRIECLNRWRDENLSRNLSASNGSQARATTIHTAQIDVCSDGAAAQLLDLIERMGGIDLYLHVSGIGKINPDLEEDIELNTLNTNGMGFVRMVGAAYRYMAARGGGAHCRGVIHCRHQGIRASTGIQCDQSHAKHLHPVA